MSLVPTVRNIWWMAMWSHDLPAGALVARRIMDEPLVFYRGDDGVPSALLDRCAHRWAPLSKGKILADGHIQCPYHGLEYDQHGVCIRNPHPNYKVPPTMRVRSYPLAEKHSAIWIWMGTAEPDPSLIPDFGWLDPDAPHPIDRRNYLLMPCAWDLMVDNLLDTSHVAILHDGNLGNAHMIDADTIVEQRGPRSLTVKRDYPNIPNTTFFDALSFHKYPRGDVYAWMSWDAPSCLTNNGWVKPVGGEMQDATGMQSCHFLTPETETSCHYHFAAMRWQPMQATPEEEAAVMRLMADMRQQAFVEQDGVMIAAQQARILEAAARGEQLRPVLIGADAGIERAHRILRDLFDEEQRTQVSA